MCVCVYVCVMCGVCMCVCVMYVCVLLYPKAGNSWASQDMALEVMYACLSFHLSWDTWSLISVFLCVSVPFSCFSLLTIASHGLTVTF